MRILTLIVTFLSLYNLSWAQDDDNVYRYHVDLNNVQEDGVNVTLDVPSSIYDNELIFHFPRITPGTYEILDYGRFVNGVKAFDKKGKELEVERDDQNTWIIKGAKRIAQVTYRIEDTWDADLREHVFEPAGTNIEAGKNFVLNANVVCGFFKGKEKLPFYVSFDRPNNFYATTSLKRVDGDFDTDVFKATDYHELVDAPIMYCEPDTVNFKLGYGDIQLSIYSPNKKVKAKEVVEKVSKMLKAQNQYLGNILPVDRYSFIVYLDPDGYPSGSVGALEHSRSSLFCLVEDEADNISKLLLDIIAHEFFHVVTPLYIHSEEIHNFNFMEPKMSKHLWMYEGVVEYMAQHMQAKYNLKDDEEFLKELRTKVESSKRYKDDISLTELSENCLVEPYIKQYNNIYYKGAMTGLCFDAKLMGLSKGKYDVQMLLRDLSGYYGQETPFKDNKLFDKIIEITGYKELKEFFTKYIEGTEVLPYNELLNPFGIEYFEETDIMEISPLGGLENGALKTDSLKRFYVSKAEKIDQFGKENLGFKQDDVILEWNDKPLKVSNVSGVLLTYMNNVKAGDILRVKVLRKQEDGSQKEVQIEQEMIKIPTRAQHVFQFMKNATEEQLRMRKIWLDAEMK